MSDFSANRPMTTRREMVLTVGQGEGDLQGGDDRVLAGWCGLFAPAGWWYFADFARDIYDA